jgi:hypothetical protein
VFSRAIILLVIFISLVTGCSNNPRWQNADIYMADQKLASEIQIVPERAGTVWLPLQELSKSIGMGVQEQNGRYAIGATDPAYTVELNRTDALIGDKLVTIADAPKQIKGKIYMTDRALADLWNMPFQWNSKSSRLMMTPIDHRAVAYWLQTYNPTDSPTKIFNFPGGTFRIHSVDTLNSSQELVNYSLSFRGTPYRFNSDFNGSPQTFDSSSFVRHVYGHFGILLPRTSLSQSEAGSYVFEDKIRLGDLLFFDALGQSYSSRSVAHVGLYIGNNRFIHTYGDPGVTVSDFNDAWHDRFLFAKRIRK